MIEVGWTLQKPEQAGLYHMRKSGENEGRVIEVLPPDKYRLTTGTALHDLPSDGYEYKTVEGGSASSA